MKLRAKELRAAARKALKGKYWWAVLAALIALVFGVGASGSVAGINGAFSSAAGSTANLQTTDGGSTALDPNIISEKITELNIPENVQKSVVAILIFFAVLISIIAIVMAILRGAVELGYCKYNLALFKEEGVPSLNYLFHYMNRVWKAFWLGILMGLKIFLWTLLFVVPGIIAAYRYSLSYFVMSENPDITASQAIKRSSAIMKGNKWNLFCLHLSFIGWGFLAALVPGIGSLLLMPYIRAADAAFYLDRSGRANQECQN